MGWLTDKLLPGLYFVSRFAVSETSPETLGAPVDLQDGRLWARCESWSDAVKAATIQSMMHKETALIVGRAGQTWKVTAGMWDGGVHRDSAGRIVKQGAWCVLPEPLLERGIVWRTKPIR